jgi:hypothetical protein
MSNRLNVLAAAVLISLCSPVRGFADVLPDYSKLSPGEREAAMKRYHQAKQEWHNKLEQMRLREKAASTLAPASSTKTTPVIVPVKPAPVVSPNLKSNGQKPADQKPALTKETTKKSAF